MPVNRQQPFEVIPQSGQTAVGANLQSSTSNIARQLEGLLQTGAAGAVSILGQQEQQKRVESSAYEAMGKLQEAGNQAQDQKDLFTVQAATQANQQAAQQVNEDMQLHQMQLKQILDQSERGVVAFIANAQPDQLRQLINSGAAQGLDPKGYLKIEERVGQRLAMEDTVDALKIIHANPNTPVDGILNGFLANNPLSSTVAKASYISTLTNDIKRFRDGEIINLVDQQRQKATENGFVRLQRDVAFDAQDGSLTAEKFVKHIQDFQQGYRDLNPRTASDLDVFAQTAKALQGVVGSGSLAKIAPERLVPLAVGLHELTKTDPMYSSLFAAAVNDINEQIKKVQSVRVDTVEGMIKGADGASGLATAGATIAVGVQSGELSPANAAELTTKLMSRQDAVANQMRADARVFRTSGAADVGLPVSAEQDKAIDDSVTRFAATHPKTTGSGQLVSWSLPEVASFTYERTGRLTQGLLDRLNTSASLPLGDKTDPNSPAIQGWADAASTIDALNQQAPVYVRDLVRSKKLDSKLALLATLNKDVPGYSITGTAQRLAGIDDSNINEAQAILSGNKSFLRHNDPKEMAANLPGGGKAVDTAIASVADLNNVVKDALDGWITWRADFGSQRATDAYQALYTFNYAQARQQGKGLAEAASAAQTNATQYIKQNYRAMDIGNPVGFGIGAERYVVPPDFPIVAGQPEYIAKRAMNDMGLIWSDAQMTSVTNLVHANKIQHGWITPAWSRVSLNLDDWRVEGAGTNKELVLPLNLDGVPMDQTQPGAFFRYPLDPSKQKTLLDARRQAILDLANESGGGYIGP